MTRVTQPGRESRAYRYAVLVAAGTMLVGSYFAYDSVGAIETTLMEALAIGRAEIGQMYAMYSIAAMFSVFLGGMLIDRIGTRRASLLFSCLLTLGAAVVAGASGLGGVYTGRLIFGVGSECLVVAQSAILARWFRGAELALAFGIALTLSRLGTLFAFNVESLVAARHGFRFALWVAAGLCLASLIANLVYNALDFRAERKRTLLRDGGMGASIGTGADASAGVGASASASTGASEMLVLADVRKGFGPSFWYVTLLCLTFYSAIFPFTALSSDLFHSKFGLPEASAEGLPLLEGVFYNLTHMFSTAQGTTAILVTASMFFAPFAGAIVDRTGRRASWMVVGSLLMIPAHLALGLTQIAPALPMLLLGAAFVLVPAALWPAVPLIVKEDRVGTAFGLMTMIQNAGLTVFPILNGYLRDATGGYAASQIMFAALGAIGLIAALLLLRADARAGSPLELTRRTSSPG